MNPRSLVRDAPDHELELECSGLKRQRAISLRAVNLAEQMLSVAEGKHTQITGRLEEIEEELEARYAEAAEALGRDETTANEAVEQFIRLTEAN